MIVIKRNQVNFLTLEICNFDIESVLKICIILLF